MCLWLFLYPYPRIFLSIPSFLSCAFGRQEISLQCVCSLLLPCIYFSLLCYHQQLNIPGFCVLRIRFPGCVGRLLASLAADRFGRLRNCTIPVKKDRFLSWIETCVTTVLAGFCFKAFQAPVRELLLSPPSSHYAVSPSKSTCPRSLIYCYFMDFMQPLARRDDFRRSLYFRLASRLRRD